MPGKITDERTLAGWLSAPTHSRASLASSTGKTPLILFADVEEHVLDVETGTTKRCDLTLRGDRGPLASAEMKRPEVTQANNPALLHDSWKKAIARGLPYFLTCNFAQVLAWETARGPISAKPVMSYTLAQGFKHSSSAASYRSEMLDNWQKFLDDFEPLLAARLAPKRASRSSLPPQAIELKEAIVNVAEEAAVRISAAASDDVYREIVLETFRAQFGVEISLDPMGNQHVLRDESVQVATICSFVVATRLMLYQALADSGARANPLKLDELDVNRATADPQRIHQELGALYEHAHRRTGDYEVQFATTQIDEILFVDAQTETDVGSRWGGLIDVIKRADWTGPAAYVPGLYESLLDDEHRHVMGVHYTPDRVAEVVAAYAVRDAADTVMDPACGAGTFASMCYERKRSLGSTHEESLGEVYASELAEFAASLAGLSLALADPNASSAYPRVFRQDFFKTYPGEESDLELPGEGKVPYPSLLDAMVGNPPYIRFENRSPHERNEVIRFLQKHFSKMQLPYPDFTGKADLWAFFVAGAHMYLRPGGRLGFVLSWNLLASDYGDAVLSFLGRYFLVDAIIDSRVERWFAAKQNTLLLLARKAEVPVQPNTSSPNPNIPPSHKVKFVRLKQPLDALLDAGQPRGKRAEDLIDELLSVEGDVGEDLRWDIRVFNQIDIVRRTVGSESGA
ncbi:N-6 DNA methylase [Krasilnikovia cinnamomea]|uniref:N-6 DNA methylase n=1 Tax=Krasilnikovia cinnamomea TaxID=349313 RepID=A0A4Q7ZEQ6_9ACTN|nr:N-6 DNA methylase [Krasilnikovia cinnamomea]RZU48741.1 N-6 DNA methylase [Krasilnikovia cinnamomea]